MFFNRSHVIKPLTPIPAKVLHTLCIFELKDTTVNILSLFKDKLLVSCSYQFLLLIYYRDGHYISNITIINHNTDIKFLFDATWTPFGNIVYTTSEDSVVLISDFGRVIKTTQMNNPTSLSVSSDKIIYVVDLEVGVHQSIDDGISWNVILISVNGWHCLKVVKLTTQNGDEFWTLEANKSSTVRLLRISKVKNRERMNDTVMWKNTNLETKYSILAPNINGLLYDENGNIFFTDFITYSVYLLSVYGHNHGRPRRLLSLLDHFNIYTNILAIDNARRQLYLGGLSGTIHVFNLKFINMP